MIRLIRLIFGLFPAFIAFPVSSAESVSNDCALPSELYMLPKGTNNLYTQSFLRRWLPYEYFVRVDGNCSFEKRVPNVTSIVNPHDGDRLVVDLVHCEDFKSLKTDTVTLRVSERTASDISNSVSVQIIGDSFVQGSFYQTALIDSCYVPGIRMVGLRQHSDGGNNFDEGRGGWTMKDYFSINKDELKPYSGFMQPVDSRRYLGARKFWINCHKVLSGEFSDFESRYQCGCFENCAKLFDAITGLPLKPTKGDLMWDTDKNCYICFNGKRWEEQPDENEKDWEFNYSKYLEIWQLEAPDFLFETLGLNDFRDIIDADYSEWDAMVTKMKDSYIKANPKGIFVIVIPCSSCGSMNNRRGDFTVRQNACMWNFRKHLIETFDNRKDEGYFLVDMGITIDNEKGYRTDSEGLQTGNPHPYPNYPAMGMPLAAFIQYYRK